MKLCVAQIQSEAGGITANINNHIKLIQSVLSSQPDLIVFPELSLSGYEPALAKDLPSKPNDAQFKILREMADKNNVVIAAGMPIRCKTKAQIGMLVFQPDKAAITYAKQLLHEDEYPYFVKGEKEVFIELGNLKIAPAICFESLQNSHVEKANDHGANVYMATVAKHTKGLKQAMNHFPKVAKKYGMTVLMSNLVGPSDDFISVGQSAIWNNKGTLVGQLNDLQEGWLMFDTVTAEVNHGYL